MAKSGDVSFVSRFLVKFVEITAAGLATAVSGYLIAHLSGAFSSSGPTSSAAVIQVTPSTSMLSSMPQPIAPSSTNSNAQASTPEQTPAPQQVSTPQQDVNGGRAPQQGPTVLDTAKLEARKHIEKAASAPESSRYKASLLDRIRAALANVDANRKDRLDVAPHQGDPPTTATPRAVTAFPSNAAASPAPVDAVERRPRPVQEAPIRSDSLPSFEIKSRPTSEAPSSVAPLEKDTGALSTLEQILRQDPLAAADNPPRPPLPIGQ